MDNHTPSQKPTFYLTWKNLSNFAIFQSNLIEKSECGYNGSMPYDTCFNKLNYDWIITLHRKNQLFISPERTYRILQFFNQIWLKNRNVDTMGPCHTTHVSTSLNMIGSSHSIVKPTFYLTWKNLSNFSIFSIKFDWKIGMWIQWVHAILHMFQQA